MLVPTSDNRHLRNLKQIKKINKKTWWGAKLKERERGGEKERETLKQENGKRKEQGAGDLDGFGIRVSDSGEETSLTFGLSTSSSV